jgi:hypothetical protein
MLTRETALDKVEVLESGAIQVREATYIVDDSFTPPQRVAGPAYRRTVYGVGTDVSGAPEMVRLLSRVVWEPAVADVVRQAPRAR